MPKDSVPKRLISSGFCRFLKCGFIAAVLMTAVSIQGERGPSAQTLKGSTTHTVQSAGAWYPSSYTIRRADVLADEYKLQAAEEIYRQALSKDSRNAGAWNGLGKIAYYRTTSSNQNLRTQKETLYAQAIQHFMTALRHQPGYVEAHVNLAQVYMEQGRMAEADEQLKQAVALASWDDNVLAARGEWLVRQGEMNEAVTVLRQAIRENSANASAHYYLSVALGARGETDLAHQELQMAQALKPQGLPTHYQLGVLYEQQGNGAAAVEAYQKALANKPELTDARKKLAEHYEKRGDIGAALMHWKNLLESGAGTWELTDHVAHLSAKNGQPEVAVQYYRQWLKAHPQDTAKTNAGISWAKTQVSKQKLRDDDLISQGEAKRYAEQAIKYAPNNYEARLIDAKLDREMGAAIGRNRPEPGFVDVALQNPAYQPSQSLERGELLLDRFQFEEAEQSFREARRSAPNVRNQMIFGELFLTKGLPQLAEEAFRQVLAERPGNASAELGLAKAREARQKSDALVREARLQRGEKSLDAAIEKASEALKYNVRNADAYYLLGQSYERRKDYAQAADHYYAYLNLDPAMENRKRVEQKIASLKQRLAKQSAKR